jgi:lipoyl(octanoyl) transferase
VVAYPIIDTARAKVGVRRLVRALGALMLGVASDLGLRDLLYDDERPGVYREGKKLGSLGLHLSRGVTSHGLAININNDLAGFHAIIPCGYADLQVSTVSRELGREITTDEAFTALDRRLPYIFDEG